MNKKIQFLRCADNHLPKVRKFRYEVVCLHDNRRVQFSDRASRQLGDEMDYDPDTTVFLAELGGSIIGTIRTSVLNEGSIRFYNSAFNTQVPIPQTGSFSFTSRLVIHPDYRNLRLFDQLVKLAFAANQPQVVGDFAVCRSELVHLFAKYGWQQVHCPAGEFELIRLETRNLEHLKACRSPFLDTLVGDSCG